MGGGALSTELPCVDLLVGTTSIPSLKEGEITASFGTMETDGGASLGPCFITLRACRCSNKQMNNVTGLSKRDTMPIMSAKRSPLVPLSMAAVP